MFQGWFEVEAGDVLDGNECMVESLNLGFGEVGFVARVVLIQSCRENCSSVSCTGANSEK